MGVHTSIEARRIKTLVREGWDRRSFLYRAGDSPRDRLGHTERQYRGWLSPLLRTLPVGAAVLDLGCGCGVPASRFLARRFQVTGVDLSGVQIERARVEVPKARFLRADMATVRFPPASFRAVVALYSIIHLPLAEQRPLFRRVYRWLRPGGTFLAILGAGRYREVTRGWLGDPSPMFWDHEGPDTYQEWLQDLGFVVEERRYIPEGKARHTLFLARKPGGQRGSRTRRSTSSRTRARSSSLTSRKR